MNCILMHIDIITAGLFYFLDTEHKEVSSFPFLPFFFKSDVNECRQNVCRPDQLCKNTRGGYKCIDLCPSGMTKAENGTCIGE